MSLNHAGKSYRDDESVSIKNEESMYNQCNGSDNFMQQNNHQNHLMYDSVLANKQNSTVDMTQIDPIIINYGLLSMHRDNISGTADSGNPDSILHPSDSDSLLSDIDMIS